MDKQTKATSTRHYEAIVSASKTNFRNGLSYFYLRVVTICFQAFAIPAWDRKENTQSPQ